MCGIHGVINCGPAHKLALEKYMEEGFVVNSVRGMDSSGILQIDKENEPFMHKLTMPGPMFIDNKATKNIIGDAGKPGTMTLGHVRAATHGKVILDNAHPFMVEGSNKKRIIGVHNGTLTSWKTKKDWSSYDVDSHWALAHIGKYGFKAFEDFDGAFVFMWWDENHPNQLFACRNTGRPLWYTLSKDKQQMLFGSESGMVSWLCERNNIETDDNIYELEPMKLYVFDYSGKEVVWTKEPVPTYKSGYTPASNTGSSYHPAQRDSWENRQQARRDAATEAFRAGEDGGEWEWDDSLPFSRNDEGRRGAANSFPAAAKTVIDASKRILGEARAALYKAENVQLTAKGGDGTASAVVDSVIVNQRDDDSPASFKERAQSNKAKRRAKKIAKAQQRAERATNAQIRASLKLNPAKPRATSLAEGLRAATAAATAASDYDAAIQAGHDRAIAESAREFPEEFLKEDWYSKGGATKAEREGAEALGIMGQMQWFQGTAYEPETGELLGDIEDFLPGEGKKKYVGVIRNMTAHRSERDYMHSGAWVAVIGVKYDRSWGGRMLICGELTDAGKTGMMKRQAA